MLLLLLLFIEGLFFVFLAFINSSFKEIIKSVRILYLSIYRNCNR